MPDLALVFDLLVAALVGLAVGIEREWTGHTAGPDGRFGGARTFTLLGALAGFGGWCLRDAAMAPLGLIVVGAAMLFAIVAYASALRRPGTTVDGTTEVVAMVVVALGVTAGLGYRSAASAAATLCVLLLMEKSALQRALKKVEPTEMRAALHFGILSLVILPLLPDGAYGPYDAFRPRALWTVVLLFSALNFAGYIARRAIGETHGLGVTGLLGGLVSSTAVTLTFSRRSRDEPALALPLALGVVAACTVLLPRVLVIAALLLPSVAVAAVPLLAPPFLTGVAIVLFAIWRDRRERRERGDMESGDVARGLGSSPLGLVASLQMAVAFQLVLFAIAWVQQNVGTTGVLASATLLGLTDVDALTVSMTRYGADPANVATAAAAMALGILSNTMLKLGLVTAIGEPRYRARAASGLLLLGIASGVGLWTGWPG